MTGLCCLTCSRIDAHGMAELCCMQKAYYGLKRLSFAYKLRSPGDALLNQYASLAANGKHFDDKYAIHCNP